MGAFQLEVSNLARLDIEDHIRNLQEFDRGAAQEFAFEVRAKARALRSNPYLHRIAYVLRGIEYRFFLSKSRRIFYFVAEDKVVIDRVYGPGQLAEGE